MFEQDPLDLQSAAAVASVCVIHRALMRTRPRHFSRFLLRAPAATTMFSAAPLRDRLVAQTDLHTLFWRNGFDSKPTVLRAEEG